MDGCEPVDYDKYAFLLGSALRSGDEESFFTVYDSILPKSLTTDQLETIKDRAREIADLPEEEFNVQVLDARSFSLAPGKYKMSGSQGKIHMFQSYETDEEDGGCGTGNCGSLADSGRPTTESVLQSLQSSESLSEEDRGVYDYYPPLSLAKDSVRISDNACSDYDEVVDVESDKSSVESPRSDDSWKGTYGPPGQKMYVMRELKRSPDNEDCLSELERAQRQRSYKPLIEEEYGEESECEFPQKFEQSSRIAPIQFSTFGSRNQGSSTPVDRSVQFSKLGLGDRDRKNRNRDESDIRGSTDENGNPVPKPYHQMREKPSDDTPNFNSFSRHGVPAGEIPSLEHGPAYNSDTKKQIGRKSKLRKETVKLSEDIPDYKGDKDIDDLLKFIEENDSKNSHVKKNGSSDARLDKSVKKNKDKKNKSVVVPSVPKPGDHIAIDIEGQTECLTDSRALDMGNSSDKVPDNNVIDGSNTQKENGQVKPHESSEKSSHKGRTDNETKTKTKNSKEEPLEKRSGKTNSNNVKKETKVNGFHQSVDASESGKDSAKGKDSKKTMAPPVNNKQSSTSETTNDKKKSAHVTNDKEKKVVNSSKSLSELKSTLPTSSSSSSSTTTTTTQCKTELDVSELDNKYIFTDLPVPLVEPEFTVVEKKKKKAVVHVRDAIASSSSSSFNSNFRDFQSTKPKFRDNNHPPPAPRSVTPPPMKSRDKSQDFSLSAFPVLSNAAVIKDKPNEARRSSIGELPMMGETSSLDDSDIASVKSLPAVQPAKMVDIFSARFQKSYAKIAAGPKPNHPQYEDASLDNYTEESDKPKQTIWKGSLTERRHSIGSSPDDGKSETSSQLTEKSRQKSGSQEVLKLETNSIMDASDSLNKKPCEDVESMYKVENADCNQKHEKLCVQENKTLTVSVDNSISHLVSHKQTDNKLVSNAVSYNSQPISTFSDNSSSRHVTSSDMPSFEADVKVVRDNSGSLMQSIPNSNAVTFLDGNSSVTANLSNVKTYPAKMSADVKISPSPSLDLRSQKVPESPTVVAKPQKNHNKAPSVAKTPSNGRRNKSVVFLDNKQDSPSNLDITFGFDDSSDVKCFSSTKSDTALKTDGMTVSESRSETVVAPVALPTHSDRSLNVCKVKPLNHVSPSSLQAGHIFTHSLLENNKTARPPHNMHSLRDHVNVLNDAVKYDGPHHMSSPRIPHNPQTVMPVEVLVTGNLTGLVHTVEGYSKPATSSVLDKPVQASDMCSPVVPDRNPADLDREESKLRIVYGDAVCDQDSKFIHFVCSRNNCGKFNHQEAVTQLRKVWEEVKALEIRRPKSVQIYGGQ